MRAMPSQLACLPACSSEMHWEEWQAGGRTAGSGLDLVQQLLGTQHRSSASLLPVCACFP